MAINRMHTTSFATLAAFIQENLVPNIFKSATYDSGTGILNCKDDEDNTALEIKGGEVASGSAYYFRAYRTATGGYIGLGFNQFPNTASPNRGIDAISCDNGLIVAMSVTSTSGYGRTFSFMITKTNNEKPAIIYGDVANSFASSCTSSINHAALGDSETITTVTEFTPEGLNGSINNASQTVLTPFATNAKVGSISYTPNAFYMPMHSNYTSDIGKFYLGMDHYITNGYWAIRDSRESGS